MEVNDVEEFKYDRRHTYVPLIEKVKMEMFAIQDNFVFLSLINYLLD